jgi:hypothetical protein
MNEARGKRAVLFEFHVFYGLLSKCVRPVIQKHLVFFGNDEKVPIVK